MRVFSLWCGLVGLAISTQAAAAPLFDGDVSRTDKVIAGVMAGSTLLNGLVYALTPSPADRYRESLQRAGLWLTWAPLPGGVSVVGTFD